MIFSTSINLILFVAVVDHTGLSNQTTLPPGGLAVLRSHFMMILTLKVHFLYRLLNAKSKCLILM